MLAFGLFGEGAGLAVVVVAHGGPSIVLVGFDGARRHGRALCLLMLDLDFFKKINDTYGHQAGDQVLKDFVELIKAYSRKEDRLFRFGGEEFLLLLPNTDQDSLQTVASHLQQQVALQLKGPGGTVTMSSGGAILQRGEHWETMLQRADQRLYLAKSAGRNRAIVADPLALAQE